MTLNWHRPIAGGRYITTNYFTEIMKAYEERLYLLRNCAGWNVIYLPEPEWAYHYILKLWDADHPKENQYGSNNNTPLDTHIHGLRGLFLKDNNGEADEAGYYSVGCQINIVGGNQSATLLYYFADMLAGDNINYGGSVAGWGGNEAIMTNALGSTSFITPNFKIIENLYPNRYTGADSISEIRKLVEETLYVIIPATSRQTRTKTAQSATSWAAAKTAFAAASWGAWGSYASSPYLSKKCDSGGIGDRYYQIKGKQSKYTFDLDLEINGFDWTVLPPLKAYLIYQNPSIQGTNPTDGMFVQCTTTSSLLELTSGNSNRGDILCADITDKVGAGHGSEDFIFTTYNDFSDADIDSLDDPLLGSEYTSYVGDNTTFTYSTIDNAVNCWIII